MNVAWMVVKESACCPVTTEMVCSPTSSSLNCISRRKWCSVFADHERASGKFTAGESTLLLCVQLSSLMQLKSEHLSLERFRSSIFSTFSFDQRLNPPHHRGQGMSHSPAVPCQRGCVPSLKYLWWWFTAFMSGSMLGQLTFFLFLLCKLTCDLPVKFWCLSCSKILPPSVERPKESVLVYAQALLMLCVN